MLHFGDVCFEPIEQKDHVSYLVKFGNEGGLRKHRISKKRTCIAEQEINSQNVHKEDDYFLFIICGPNVKSRIGICEIYNVNWTDRTCKLSLWFSDRAEVVPRYGTKALNIALNYIFGTLGLNKVTADVSFEDVVMLSLYKKHYFVQEVRKRNHLFVAGSYVSIIEMGLLAKEFEIVT